jgi:chorismate dehydratase
MSEATPFDHRIRIGCVSFLNARPLIDGLDDHPMLDVRYAVPSRLLDDLLGDVVDIALCPVVDYQSSRRELAVVPVGGIGSEAATLTVRLFSRVPLEDVQTVHADTDSHTSIVLAQLILHDVYGVRPRMQDLRAAGPRSPADTLLLIGDKVVRRAPSQADYPHQLDLGHAWRDLTGLPFVFAVWMCLPDQPLGNAPQLLDAQRQANRHRIGEIVERHAAAAGFPQSVARTYLADLLRYEVGPRELAAMQHFWQRAYGLGLLAQCRPLRVHHDSRATSDCPLAEEIP